MNPPTRLRPVAKKKKRLLFGKKRAEQRAARHEVLEEIKQNPIGGYGLYHVLDDAGLLSKDTKEDLASLIASIEQRLHLPDDALTITLPLPFEPITDIEHDTLTSVIGQALREFAQKLPGLKEPLLLAELFGLNDMLKRHAEHTASIDYEAHLEHVLAPLLKACGTRLPFYRPDRMVNAQPGDYFHVTQLRRSKQKFSRAFLEERNIQEGEVVQIEEIWDKGYLFVRRLSYTASYSREWTFDYLDRRLPWDDHFTAVNKDEGVLYRLGSKYTDAVRDFIKLYQAHREDRSEDPTRYRPTGPRKV